MSNILLITETPDLAETLPRLLEASDCRVETAQTASEALEALRKEPFDLVVTGLHLPEMDGVRLARIIRAGVYSTPWSVPILLVTTALDDRLSAELLDETGMSEFIQLPCDLGFLRDRILHHLSAPIDSPQPSNTAAEDRSLLLVDDEPEFVGMLTQALSGLGYRLLTALKGEDALRIVREEKVALTLLDYMLPDMNGLKVLREIRKLQPETLVVMLTGHGSQEMAVECLWAGAADYLEKPVPARVLRRTIVEVIKRGHAFRMSSFLHGQIRTLKEQAHRIERLKRLNEAIVGSLPDPLCVLDRQSRVVTANPEFLSRFRLSVPEGTSVPLAKAIPDPQFRAVIERAINQGAPFAGLEAELPVAEGTRRAYRARAIPLLAGLITPDGPADDHTLLVLHDITEERRARAMEDQLRAEKEQALLTSTFVKMLSGAAHELNNPLAVIMGLSDLGASPDPNSTLEQMSDMFGRILEQSRRCQTIVRDLTQFLAHSRSPLSSGSVHQVIERAVENKRAELEARSVHVRLPEPASVPQAVMNTAELTQVFENVLDNACHAFEEAGRSGEIRISLGVEKGDGSEHIFVDIANDGPPIPEESLQQIFLPFVTTRGVGRGRGLGLAVCYGIVRHHGGKILARNLPEGGCAFRVSLPVASDPHRPPS